MSNPNKSNTAAIKSCKFLSETQESNTTENTFTNVETSTVTNITNTTAKICNQKITTENNRKQITTETVQRFELTSDWDKEAVLKLMMEQKLDLNSFIDFTVEKPFEINTTERLQNNFKYLNLKEDSFLEEKQMPPEGEPISEPRSSTGASAAAQLYENPNSRITHKPPTGRNEVFKSDPFTKQTGANKKILVPEFQPNINMIPKNLPNPASSLKTKAGPGILYIFNHDDFDAFQCANETQKPSARDGSRNDVILLKETFQKFNVHSEVINNPSVSQVQTKIDEISVKDFTYNSCIILVILSHGKRDGNIAACDAPYNLYDNILFQIVKNRTLTGKPKIFLVQACKGDKNPLAIQTDNVSGPYVPGDTLMFFSTVEGFVSFRNASGSPFIKTFCAILSNDGKTKNIKDITDSVIEKVKTDLGSFQIPHVEENLTTPYIFGDYI